MSSPGGAVEITPVRSPGLRRRDKTRDSERADVNLGSQERPVTPVSHYTTLPTSPSLVTRWLTARPTPHALDSAVLNARLTLRSCSYSSRTSGEAHRQPHTSPERTESLTTDLSPTDPSASAATQNLKLRGPVCQSEIKRAEGLASGRDMFRIKPSPLPILITGTHPAQHTGVGLREGAGLEDASACDAPSPRCPPSPSPLAHPSLGDTAALIDNVTAGNRDPGGSSLTPRRRDICQDESPARWPAGLLPALGPGAVTGVRRAQRAHYA
ncbi:hypothetical protein AAFF_G00150460 [Aldrovandia affinis]|uniref:Uncharacterized protein n=1 Tax=Aldrovandia affinis TaxID=143900 RepID=A0AAD7RPA6_9TELE|nr:hypothetical protein AAFF_G00150460 [Aldrovandia affinis]